MARAEGLTTRSRVIRHQNALLLCLPKLARVRIMIGVPMIQKTMVKMRASSVCG